MQYCCMAVAVQFAAILLRVLAVTTSKWDMFEQYASSGSDNDDVKTANDDIDGM